MIPFPGVSIAVGEQPETLTTERKNTDVKTIYFLKTWSRLPAQKDEVGSFCKFGSKCPVRGSASVAVLFIVQRSSCCIL